MSNLVIVTGDFCSGSTLLSTLFRKTEQFCCLYEPLHELLPEYLAYKVQPLERDHHFFMDDYYRELRTFPDLSSVFDPKWGTGQYFLAPGAEADDLYRYLAYLIGTAFGRSSRVMFKENRIAFRLGWVRAAFPQATIVHIYRDRQDQWKSVVRRVQAHHGREDVGQERVGFTGFGIARWCDDLAPRFPELEAARSSTGFERFGKLWELSYQHNVRSSDISIDYKDLLQRFEPTCERLWNAIGVTGIDTAALKQYVVPPERQQQMLSKDSRAHMMERLQVLLRRYGRVRARLAARRRPTR
jgi:hypothetical protein